MAAAEVSSPQHYLGSRWIWRGSPRGSAAVSQCLGWVSGRPRGGCALSERACGGRRALSVRGRGDRGWALRLGEGSSLDASPAVPVQGSQ